MPSLKLGLIGLVAIGAHVANRPPQTVQMPLFTSAEAQQIVLEWNEPGRMQVIAPPSAAKNGRWQVRTTTEGSTWIWNYNRALGLGKRGLGTADGANANATYDEWIKARIAWERAACEAECAEKNGQSAAPSSPASDPGDAPDGLVELVGPIPKFAEVVQPKGYRVTFPNFGTTFTYEDHVNTRPTYAYYRFPEGVQSGGMQVKTMPASTLDALMKKAGVTGSAMRVMKAVSLLEGGFDSINTYDTGFLSVGLIQFATLKDGAGSLGEVMRTFKAAAPQEFRKIFHNYGIDVMENGAIVAVNLKSGKESSGAAGVAEIIRDPRLAAVFQNAGQKSDAFKIAQLQVAMSRYFPANERVTILLTGGNVASATVDQIFRTEAGMATLMDRKVNTGKLDPLEKVLQEIADQYQVASIEDLAALEYQIVARLRFRKDYLGDVSLSQPRDMGSSPSRGGTKPRQPNKS